MRNGYANQARPHTVPGFDSAAAGTSVAARCRRCGGVLRRTGHVLEGTVGLKDPPHPIIVCGRCGWTWWVHADESRDPTGGVKTNLDAKAPDCGYVRGSEREKERRKASERNAR